EPGALLKGEALPLQARDLGAEDLRRGTPARRLVAMVVEGDAHLVEEDAGRVLRASLGDRGGAVRDGAGPVRKLRRAGDARRAEKKNSGDQREPSNAGAIPHGPPPARSKTSRV